MAGRRRSQRLQETVPKPEPEANESGMVGVDSASSPLSQPPSPSAAKRGREEDGVEVVDEPPCKTRVTHVKHDVHWALDGNLLLQFGDVRFKVHRSRLAAESDYFQAIIDTSNGNPNKNYKWQEEVERIVAKKEVVDGTDCFFMDIGVGVSAEAFAALLTCMNSAITYRKNGVPELQTIKMILLAANDLCMTQYTDFAVNEITQLFASTVDDVEEGISPHAIDGVLLADMYAQLHKIRAPAFYELARRSPEEGSAVDSVALKRLDVLNLRKLLHLQRKLSQAWDDLPRYLEVGGSKGPECCGKHHVFSLQTFMEIKAQFPFDPILGIRHLGSMNWAATKYCKTAITHVKKVLKAKANVIWTSIPVCLADIPDDSDSDSSDDDSASTKGTAVGED